MPPGAATPDRRPLQYPRLTTNKNAPEKSGPMPDLQFDLDQLEDQGYTIVRQFMDRTLTARARQHTDALLPPAIPADQPTDKRVHTLRHPIPGSIMVDLITQTALHDIAVQILRGDQLRLLEQVLMRSDPRPPPYGPLGWHIDFAFLPAHYRNQPRQVYFQMITHLVTVESGPGPLRDRPRLAPPDLCRQRTPGQYRRPGPAEKRSDQCRRYRYRPGR